MTPRRPKLIEVAPTGTRKAFGHLNRGNQPHQWGEFEMPDYPPSPEGKALRDERVRLGLSLGDAARALGISVVEMSNLERGRMVAERWADLYEALCATRAERGRK